MLGLSEAFEFSSLPPLVDSDVNNAAGVYSVLVDDCGKGRVKD